MARQIDDTIREKIATYLNDHLNIPRLNEDEEQVIFRWVVDKICDRIEKHLPKQYLDWLNDISSGIAKGRTEELIDNTVRYINKRLDLILLNEKQEEWAIRKVVEFIVRGTIKGRDLASVVS